MSDTWIPRGFRDPRFRKGLVPGLCANIALLVFMVLWSMALLDSVAASSLMLGLGVIGVWRHGWGLMNFARAQRYRRLSASTTAALRFDPDMLLIAIVTFYDQSDEQVASVSYALAEALEAFSTQPLLVVAYRTARHRLLVERIVADRAALQFVRQNGEGKRAALADCLSLVMDKIPSATADRAGLLLVDGDTVVTRQAVTQSAASLATRPDLGAVVVNEWPLLQDGGLFGLWRLLRSLQRNKLMMAFALSDRVLVLTGRFAMIRASILLKPDVVNRMRRDYLLTDQAYIPMLTGDDKTTWLEVLRQGYAMTYLPEAVIHPIETPDLRKGFVRTVYALSQRYSGNMARANLHPDAWRNLNGKLHFHYGLLDQRISMWTSLLTPCILLFLLISGQIPAFVVFLTYVLVIKNIQALALAMVSRHYDPLFPYLIFFDQVVQSIAKIHAFAFMHRQVWTNQGVTTLDSQDTAILDQISRRMVILRVGTFVVFLVYIYILLI